MSDEPQLPPAPEPMPAEPARDARIEPTRRLTLDFVRKELAKIGDVPEELIFYVWHASNGRTALAEDYFLALKEESLARVADAYSADGPGDSPAAM